MSAKGLPFKRSLSFSTGVLVEVLYCAFKERTGVDNAIEDNVTGCTAGLGRRGFMVRLTVELNVNI